jgi:hypothetical protein
VTSAVHLSCFSRRWHVHRRRSTAHAAGNMPSRCYFSPMLGYGEHYSLVKQKHDAHHGSTSQTLEALTVVVMYCTYQGRNWSMKPPMTDNREMFNHLFVKILAISHVV